MKLVIAIIAVLLTGLLVIGFAVYQKESERRPEKTEAVQTGQEKQQVELEVKISGSQESEPQAAEQESEPQAAEQESEPQAAEQDTGSAQQSAEEAACLRLIEIRQEELEDAMQDYEDAVEEYEKAFEAYDEAFGPDTPNETTEQLKQNYEELEKEMEEKEEDFKGAERKLRDAKIECGVY